MTEATRRGSSTRSRLVDPLFSRVRAPPRPRLGASEAALARPWRPRRSQQRRVTLSSARAPVPRLAMTDAPRPRQRCRGCEHSGTVRPCHGGLGQPTTAQLPQHERGELPGNDVALARGALRCCRVVGETSSAGAEPLRAAVAGCLLSAGGRAKVRAPWRPAKKASAARPARGRARRERTTRRSTARAQPLWASRRVVGGLSRLQAPPDAAGPGSAKRGRCARALVAWPLREKRLRARSLGGGATRRCWVHPCCCASDGAWAARAARS